MIEKGTLKCHQYWPASAGETVTCEAVELSITNINFVPGDHYNVSTLRSVCPEQYGPRDNVLVRLTHLGTEEEREVLHFHYTTWPDFGVPTCPDTFLQFLGKILFSVCVQPVFIFIFHQMPCEIRIAWHPQWDQLLSIAPQESEGKLSILVAWFILFSPNAGLAPLSWWTPASWRLSCLAHRQSMSKSVCLI